MYDITDFDIEEPVVYNSDSDSDSYNPEDLNTLCQGCGQKTTFALDQRNGIVVCESCGKVSQGVIAMHSGHVTSDDNGGTNIDKNRTGGPTNTFLSNSGGVNLNLPTRVANVRRWTALPYKDAQLYKTYKNISAKAEKDPNVTKVVLDQAKSFYWEISKNLSTRAMPKKAIQAVCLLEAANVEEIGLTRKDVAKLWDIPLSAMTTAISRFNSVMLDSKHGKYLIASKTTLIESYIKRYCNLLLMGERHIIVAKSIADTARITSILCESVPTSIAVASIYFMIMHWKIDLPIEDILEHIEQVGISCPNKKKFIKKKKPAKQLLHIIADVTEVTINRAYKTLNADQNWILVEEGDKQVSKNYLVMHINVTEEQLAIVVPKIKPKFI